MIYNFLITIRNIICCILFISCVHNFTFAAEYFDISTFRWSADLESGKLIEVTNNYGDIRVRNSKGGGLGISAIIQNLKENQEIPQINIVEKENGGGYQATVVYSTDNSDANDYQGRVDVTLLVPLQTFLVATTTFGDIYVRFKGSAQAKTEGGNLSINVSEHVQAETNSGSITVWLKDTEQNEPIKFETVSGDVIVKFLDSASIDIYAKTKGHIATYPLSDDTSIDSQVEEYNELTWKFGAGDSSLSIESISGDVQIHVLEFLESLSDATAPTVMEQDLRDLPQSETWTPGQPIKEIPRN